MGDIDGPESIRHLITYMRVKCREYHLYVVHYMTKFYFLKFHCHIVAQKGK